MRIKKLISKITLLFLLFSTNSYAECNQDALKLCDDNYELRYDLDQTRFNENLQNCFDPFLEAVIDLYSPDKIGTILGDIGDMLLDLSQLPQLFEVAETAQNCASNSDEIYWVNWEGNMDAWHRCEADPESGNCPDRALMTNYPPQ